MPRKLSFDEGVRRFWSRLIPEPNTGCWLWSGTRDQCGYGLARLDGLSWRAHRLAWFLTQGAIQKPMNVLHRCDTPACANPEHLFLGDHSANMRDMVRKGRHWTSVRPHRRARGERHGLRLHPESAARGEQRWNAVLTVDSVRAIRMAAALGERAPDIARRFGVQRQAIQKVIARKTWAHVV